MIALVGGRFNGKYLDRPFNVSIMTSSDCLRPGDTVTIFYDGGTEAYLVEQDGTASPVGQYRFLSVHEVTLKDCPQHINPEPLRPAKGIL